MRTLLLALMLLTATAVHAETLTWNANSEPDLAGYKVYQRTATQSYGLPLAIIGKVAQFVLPTLSPGEYFWAVTAFDLANNESVKSAEGTKVILPPPPTVEERLTRIESHLTTLDAESRNHDMTDQAFSIMFISDQDKIKALELTVAAMGAQITKLEATHLALCRALGGC